MRTLREEYNSLGFSLRRRIRISCIISGVWAAFILGSAGIFYLSKPYLDKRRLEREALLIADGRQDELPKIRVPKEPDFIARRRWDLKDLSVARGEQDELSEKNVPKGPGFIAKSI